MSQYFVSNRNIWGIGLILLMLFTSGSISFFVFLSPAIAYVIFLICSFSYFLFTNNKIKINSSLFYILYLYAAVLLNVFVFNPHVEDNRWMGLLIGAISSYFFYSSFDFSAFRKLYLEILSGLTLLSILAFIVDLLDLLPTQNVEFNGVNHKMFFFLNMGRGGSFNRMASIWHEPGACQIFLNMALLLYLPIIRSGNITKKEFRMLCIIVLGIVCTQSTTGYLILIILLYYSLKPKISNLKSIHRFGAFTLMVLFVLLVLSSEVVWTKLNPDPNEVSSLATRRSDNIACLKMALEKPFTGYGIDTKEFNSMSYKLDNISSSNGLLQISAFLGISWLLIYTILVRKAIKRMNLSINVWIALIIFYLLESNEAYIEYPISYMFVFTFNSYLKLSTNDYRKINRHRYPSVQL